MLCNPWKNGNTTYEMVTYYYPKSCFNKPVCTTTTTSTSSTTTSTTTQVPLSVCFFYGTESSGLISCLIPPSGTYNGKPLYQLRESNCIDPVTGNSAYVYWSIDNNRWESTNGFPGNPFVYVTSYLNVSSQTPISGPSNVWITEASESVYASGQSCPVVNPPVCFTINNGEIDTSWTSYPENTLYNNYLYYIINGYYVYFNNTNYRWEFSSSLGGVTICFLNTSPPYPIPNFYFSWECNEAALVYITNSSVGTC